MVKRPPKDDPDQGLLDFVPERLDRTGSGQFGDKPGGHGRLVLSIALGLAAVVATVVTVWYIFADQPVQGTKGGVPVVAADAYPFKSKPVEPGGMEVPNQDKLVYDRLGHADAPAQAERLLPPPEAPKVPPAKPAKTSPPSLATPKPAVENITAEAKAPPKPAASEPPAATPAPPPAVVVAENAPPSGKPAVAPAPPSHTPEPPKAEAPKPASSPAALVAPKAEPPKPQPPQQQTAAVAPPKILPGKDAGWRIQIAAMRDAETAEKEWGRVAGANRDLLGGLASDILRADLGAKGIFYRVRGGPLDEAAARKLCDDLGKRKIGCMVVKK